MYCQEFLQLDLLVVGKVLVPFEQAPSRLALYCVGSSSENPFQPHKGHEDSLTRHGSRFGEGVSTNRCTNFRDRGCFGELRRASQSSGQKICPREEADNRPCFPRDSGETRKAGEGTRTLDIQLGKLALYQLSYARGCLFSRARRRFLHLTARPKTLQVLRFPRLPRGRI